MWGMSVLAKLIAPLTRIFHPRGTQRILRIFFSPRKLKIKGVMNYDHNLRINFDTSSYVERELFFRGYYEKNVINAIKKFLKPGFTAIDAGANIGTHALIMAKAVGNSGKILAFEPHPESAERLKANINLNNFSNIEVLESALSDKSGKMTLFSYEDGLSDHGTASLYDLPRLQKKGTEIPVSTIDVVTEEENLERLDFIKIDTRGSDFPIILGARESIKKFSPLIIFEYNRENWSHSNSKWEEAKMFFDENNYGLYFINQKNILPIGVSPVFTTSHNILAIPKSRASEINLKL